MSESQSAAAVSDMPSSSRMSGAKYRRPMMPITRQTLVAHRISTR